MAVTAPPMTTLQLVQYYANLLILQYLQEPRAYATILAQAAPVIMPQTSVYSISFPVAPTSGQFSISYNGSTTGLMSWNNSASTIQALLRTLPGLASVVVTGSIAGQLLSVSMVGITPPSLTLNLVTNTLKASGTTVTPIITETDMTLPNAVQAGFNVTGSSPAQGVQLDVIGKYAGVVRSGNGFAGPIVLDDSDFLSLIQIAIITNNAGSSLATIQQLLFQFFPNELLVFDFQNMQMGYFMSSVVGSQNLAQMFITQGLLPKPMGVQLATLIYGPTVNNFFGFRTYDLAGHNISNFNTYDSYSMTSPWLSYNNGIVI